MNIQYFGTGAYEAIPSMFCHCRVCQIAREQKGKEMRSRAQALINDEILMDFGPDTVFHYQRFLFDPEKIKACLITHAHSDHFYPEDVPMVHEPYSHGHAPFHFYATEAAWRALCPIADASHGDMTVTLVRPGERFSIADGRYSVLPLAADHEKETGPVIYSITGEGKRILYAHDTGVFPEETFAAMAGEGCYDLISFDCTGGLGLDHDWVSGHMSFRPIRDLLARMKAAGMADDHTVCVLNHFSHNGGQTHAEMCAAVEPYGFTVAYDGMELSF